MEREFRGVWIPKQIWCNKDLSAIDKVILTEIDSLDNVEHCTANNDYFAEFCDISVPTVKRSIKKLEELGLIDRVGYDGRVRTLKSNLQHDIPSIESHQTAHFDTAEVSKRATLHYNNNININYIDDGSQHARFEKPSVEEIKDEFKAKGYPDEAEIFYSFYESKGWMVGKNKMKNWKQAVSGWCARCKQRGQQPIIQQPKPNIYHGETADEKAKRLGIKIKKDI